MKYCFYTTVLLTRNEYSITGISNTKWPNVLIFAPLVEINPKVATLTLIARAH